MKKFFLGLIITSLAAVGCLKSNNNCGYASSNAIAPYSEVTTLKDTLDTLKITNVSLDPSGVFYTINQAGSGNTVTNLCSTISATYKGTFLNGTPFDSTVAGQVSTFQLGQVIVGWQKTIPYIAAGGSITLYIPPSLAYGTNPVTDNNGNVIIPGGSYLEFKIQVTNIQ